MNRKWWIPVHIILLFWIESLFVNFSPDFINNEIRASIPRFLFLYFIFISVYYDRKLGVLLVFFVGIVMDVVFSEVLGIYLFLYPLIIFSLAQIAKFIYNNLFIIYFVTLIALVGLEFAVYGMYTLLNIAQVPVDFFVNQRLMPTLIMNTVFYILIGFPLKKYLLKLKKVKEEEEGMFQS